MTIVHDLPEQEYHAHPSLSSTGARKLLDSPARYRWAQDHPQEHKDAFDLGSAVHAKVLGTGSDIVLLDFDNWRTKSAQEERDQARADGQIAMLRRDYQPVEDMAEAVLAHPGARSLLLQAGNAEASVFATDSDTGVDMRARFDYLPVLDATNPIAVDLKTTGKEASIDGFTKSVAAFGYDVQQAWYQHVLTTSTGLESIPFAFIVVETSAPHIVAVHQLDIEWARMGADKVRRAIDLFCECANTDTWPGYGDETHLISPPNWLVYQHEEEYGPIETTIVKAL